MKLYQFAKRLDAIEDAIATPGGCTVCHGLGNVGPFSTDSIPSPVCPSCGRIAQRQHVVDVPVAELAAMFAPAPRVALTVVEDA